MSPIVAEPPRGASNWRSNAQPVVAERPKSTSSDVSFKSATEPKKPVLNLLPRSKPISSTPEAAQVYIKKGGADPFGGAKPVDKPAESN